MKPFIDWVLIFFLLFILHAIATDFLLKLNLEPVRKLDRELYQQDLGIMYYFPVNKG